MDRRGLFMIGLCAGIIIASGCISQTQEEQATGANDQQGAIHPQGQPFGQQGQNMRRGLPPEMMDACLGKAVNDTCEFKFNETVMNGTCRSWRAGNLTCFPSNMGQGGMFRNGSQQWRRGGQGPPDNQQNG